MNYRIDGLKDALESLLKEEKAKDGHWPGYMMRNVGGWWDYSCPRHPETGFKNLEAWDLHYEIEHLKYNPENGKAYM